MKQNREIFTTQKMAEKLDKIIEKSLKGLPEAPQQVQLKLPKLKKVNKEKSETPKIKLPKLKKVTA